MNAQTGPTWPPAVQGVRISSTGLCTNEQIFATDLYPLFTKSAMDSLPCEALDQLDIYDIMASPVLRADGRYQFFVRLDLYGKKTVVVDLDCAMSASAVFDVMVDDNGALVFAASLDKSGVTAFSGSGCNDVEFMVPIVDPGAPLGFNFIRVSHAGAKLLVRWFLLRVLISSINKNVRDKQALLSTFINLLNPNDVACDPTVAQDYDPYIVGNALIRAGDNTTGVCAGARQLMCQLVRDGFVSQGFRPSGSMSPTLSQDWCAPQPNPNVHELWLEQMLQAVNAADIHGHLRHWACRTPCPAQDDTVTNVGTSDVGRTAYGTFDTYAFTVADQVRGSLASGKWPNPNFGSTCKHGKDSSGQLQTNPTVGECQFVIPARRFIGNPDGVKLVFYDNAQDWSNAALAAEYAIHGALAGGLGTILQALGKSPASVLAQMCNYRRPSLPVFPRRYAVFQVPGPSGGSLHCRDNQASQDPAEGGGYLVDLTQG